MMLRCDRAMLDIDKGILFCDDGGPCGKRLHCGDCPLVTQKEEKSFEIGQRVRIVGPTADERATYVGECFTIDQILVSGGKYDGYSRHDCDHWFPASSLELVGPEPDRLEAIERRLDSIEKRLQPVEDTAVIKTISRQSPVVWQIDDTHKSRNPAEVAGLAESASTTHD